MISISFIPFKAVNSATATAKRVIRRALSFQSKIDLDQRRLQFDPLQPTEQQTQNCYRLTTDRTCARSCNRNNPFDDLDLEELSPDQIYEVAEFEAELLQMQDQYRL